MLKLPIFGYLASDCRIYRLGSGLWNNRLTGFSDSSTHPPPPFPSYRMTKGSAYGIYWNQQILTLLYKWNNVIPSVSDKYVTKQAVMPHSIRGPSIKFANSNLEGFFIMNLYQLEKQSTKFTNLEVRRRLREKVRRKRPELFGNNSCILHHDNAPAHTALSVREFLVTKQITVLEHPANHRI